VDITTTRRRVFSYPMMSKTRLRRYFKIIDDTLNLCLRAIDANTTWVNRAISDVLGKVAGYNTCKYYVVPAKDSTKANLRNTYIVNSKDVTAIFDSNLADFVVTAMYRLADIAFGQPHDVDFPLYLLRGFKYEIIRDFLNNTDRYTQQVKELVLLRQRSYETNDSRELSIIVDEQSMIQHDLYDVERRVGASGNYLHALIRFVDINMQRVHKLQSRIVQSYAKKAWTVAQDFSGKSDRWILRYFQSGTLGLTKSILYFDMSLNQNFGSYAEWWIRQEILSDIRKSNLIAETSGTLTKRSRLSRISKKLEGRGVDPTIQRLSEDSGLQEDHVARLLKQSEDVKPISLETPIGHNGNATLLDLLIEDAPQDKMGDGLNVLKDMYRDDTTAAKAFAMYCGCEEAIPLDNEDFFKLMLTHSAGRGCLRRNRAANKEER